jgi:hypothetical protein
MVARRGSRKQPKVACYSEEAQDKSTKASRLRKRSNPHSELRQAGAPTVAPRFGNAAQSASCYRELNSVRTSECYFNTEKGANFSAPLKKSWCISRQKRWRRTRPPSHRPPRPTMRSFRPKRGGAPPAPPGPRARSSSRRPSAPQPAPPDF